MFTSPPPVFFSPPRLRQRRESSWSRLCSADSVGSIPPNVYFVLLRRTRIHRVPPSNVAEGGHVPGPLATKAVGAVKNGVCLKDVTPPSGEATKEA